MAVSYQNIDSRLTDEIVSMIYRKNTPDGKKSMNLTFYGYFFTRINFEEVHDNSTACVYAKGSRLYLRYNKKFIDVLDREELRFLLMHELSHLLFSHLNRIGDRNPRKANVVADMIINTAILEDFDSSFKQIHGKYDLGESNVLEIPKLLVPPEFKGRRIFEELYDWMEEQVDNDKSEDSQGEGEGEGQGEGQGEGEGEGQGEGQGEGSGSSQGKGSGSGESEELQTGKKMFKDINQGKDVQCTDDHSDLSEAEKQIVDSITKDIVEGLRNRGLVSAEVDGFLGKLKSSRKNNLKWILQNLSYVIGTKVAQTWAKPNRYGISKKGEKMEGHQLNVILDVSGSMYGLHEKVLSTVYQNGIQCNIILADTTVKGFHITRSKEELQKLPLKGFGGTVLQPAIEYIKADKELKQINTLVLTDGYCDSLDFSELKGRKMIITTHELVRYKGANVKQKKLEV